MRGGLLLTVAAASLFCLGAAPAPRAIPLKKAPSSAADTKQICALPGVACGSPADVALYKTAEGAWWAILPSRPALLSLSRGDKGWALTKAWDFEGRDRFVADSSSRSIHPALYPVAPGVWAAALVETRSEGYSGGGAAFSSAVFIPLDGRTASPLPNPVPFSCMRMVRACFAENEYKTSKHCHDEWDGWLTLSYTQAPGQGAYAWAGTWRESVWPQAVAKSQTKTTATTLDKASFCEFSE